MAILLALLSSAMWGTADFLGGTMSRRLPLFAVVAVSGALGLAGLLIFAAAVGAFDAPTGYIGWALLGAVAGSAGLLAFYEALATGTMGVVAPIAALGVTVPVVVGIVQGDRPNLLQGAGVLIAILGVVLASGPELQSVEGERSHAVRPLLLAVIAAVGFGLVLVAIDRGARSSTIMTLVVLRGVGMLIVVAIALATGGRKELVVGVPDVPLLAVTGLFDAGANVAFAYASRHGLLSLVAVLSSLYPAVTVVLARMVHAERLKRVQMTGVVAALAGVALLAAAGAG